MKKSTFRTGIRTNYSGFLFDFRLVIPKNHKKLHLLKVDHLYHLALDTEKDDLEKMFGDVRFVCFGGQPSRMEKFSALVARELNIDDHEMDGDRPRNYAAGTDRYSIHKVGPVLSVSVSQ